MYDSHDTRTVTIRSKQTVKSILGMDYNEWWLGLTWKTTAALFI
jgi:hypothetical protein